ncbi:unnamed protein product [Vicia faba]|uniref:Uncharacterized protein n=1 Tax=Vicia faba TaxID=3906 RepID=A0AAV0ZZJ7_VICFA|nr:unnamed protein product [Vicia faba]
MSSNQPSILSVNQKGKRKFSSSNPLPQIRKKNTSKVQASKETFDTHGKIKRYVKDLLNKPIEDEYYGYSFVECDLKVSILKLFQHHKLLKFIGLKRKFNLDHVKVF